MFSYYPSFIVASLQKQTRFQCKRALEVLDNSKYLGTIEKRATQKPFFTKDEYFCSLLDKAGFDVHELQRMYGLTPISHDSVYDDFSKYHTPIDYSGVDYKQLETGAKWLMKHKLRCMKKRARILDYDEVVQLIDKTKSATAFFNLYFRNKGDLMESDDFKISFVLFLVSYIEGEAIYLPWVTFQKEEIRPGEKIDLEKFRSIVIGPIYSLILGHMLYADMDALVAENWLEYGTGIGMSPFGGDYHRLMSQFDGSPCYSFSDVGKYDSRQSHYLKQLAAFVADGVYEVRVVRLYTMLGSLAKVASALGFADRNVNTYALRNKLCEDSTIGPVILPRGEMYFKDRGENSGDSRTGPGNVDRYKIVEFGAGSKFYDSLEEYHAAGYFATHTGDDKLDKGPDQRVSLECSRIWKAHGADIEEHFASRLEDCDYLSTMPVKIRLYNGDWWVPKFNTAKIVAGLACKLGERTPDNDIQRLAAARLLSEFSQDKKGVKHVISLYLAENPTAVGHPAWKNDEECISSYIGSLQSSFAHFSDLPGHKGKLDQYRVKTSDRGMSGQIAAAIGGALTEKVIDAVTNKLSGKPKKRNRRKKAAPPKKEASRMVKQAPRRKQDKERVDFGRPARPPVARTRTGLSTHYKRVRVNEGGNYGGFRVSNDHVRIVGRDLIGNITCNAAPYTNVVSQILNPLAIPGSRLAIESTLWTKFRFLWARLVFVTGVGTTSPGNVTYSHLDDPEMTPPPEGTLSYLQSMLSVDGARMEVVWKDATHKWVAKDNKREFYISPDMDGEERFTCQASLLAIQNFNSTAGNTLGMFFLEWEIILYDPIINYQSINTWSQTKMILGNNGVAGQSVSISDAAGYNPIKLHFAAAEPRFTGSTVYACYFNFDFATLRSFSIYFFKTDANFPSTIDLHKNPTDAATGAAASRLAGSFLGGSLLPSSGATMWFSTAFVSPPSAVPPTIAQTLPTSAVATPGNDNNKSAQTPDEELSRLLEYARRVNLKGTGVAEEK